MTGGRPADRPEPRDSLLASSTRPGSPPHAADGPRASLHVFPDRHLGLVTMAEDLGPPISRFLVDTPRRFIVRS